ncbi:MAG TPA: type II secretion system protein [Mycobacteriales bacterium]|nr:type II secretion system protein [Mycobacteriales bacterium]
MTARRAPVTRQRRNRDAGFTLTEMLVVTVLFGIVGTIVTTMSVTALRQQTRVQDRSDTLAQARTALERIDRDIRSANPLLAASPTTLVLREVEPSLTRTVTYSAANNQLVTSESDTTSAGATTTSSTVLLRNLANSTSVPLFSVTPVLGYTAPAGSGVSASTCAMSSGFDPGCIGVVTVDLLVRPSSTGAPINISDSGTELRNAP